VWGWGRPQADRYGLHATWWYLRSDDSDAGATVKRELPAGCIRYDMVIEDRFAELSRSCGRRGKT